MTFDFGPAPKFDKGHLRKNLREATDAYRTNKTEETLESFTKLLKRATVDGYTLTDLSRITKFSRPTLNKMIRNG